MKTIFAIAGRTNSGKDTITKIIGKEEEIPVLCSYTDRPMRKDDIDGISHFFLSKREFDELLKKQQCLAYTKIEDPKSRCPGYRYCTTVEQIEDCESDSIFYIIDPAGIEFLKSNFSDRFNVVVISIMTPQEIREKRSVARGDSKEGFISRNANERAQFDAFESNLNNYDYYIINNGTLDEAVEQLRHFVEIERGEI